MNVQDILQRGVEYASTSLSAYVTTMAGIGTLSMALIQAVKDMIPVRRWYQRWWLRNRLAALAAQCEAGGMRVPADPTRQSSEMRPVNPTQAEKQLLELATAGDAGAFYDLQIEQLCGQMTSASQIAMDYPNRSPDLVLCLGASADGKDFVRVFEQSARYEDRSQVEAQLFADARNRLGHQVQRAIDGIQIAAGFQWKWILQVIAILLSGMLGIWAYSTARGSTDMGGGAAVFFMTGILGGFLAPVARDLVAGLQSLRGRR